MKPRQIWYLRSFSSSGLDATVRNTRNNHLETINRRWNGVQFDGKTRSTTRCPCRLEGVTGLRHKCGTICIILKKACKQASTRSLCFSSTGNSEIVSPCRGSIEDSYTLTRVCHSPRSLVGVIAARSLASVLSDTTATVQPGREDPPFYDTNNNQRTVRHPATDSSGRKSALIQRGHL